MFLISTFKTPGKLLLILLFLCTFISPSADAASSAENTCKAFGGPNSQNEQNRANYYKCLGEYNFFLETYSDLDLSNTDKKGIDVLATSICGNKYPQNGGSSSEIANSQAVCRVAGIGAIKSIIADKKNQGSGSGVGKPIVEQCKKTKNESACTREYRNCNNGSSIKLVVECKQRVIKKYEKSANPSDGTGPQRSECDNLKKSKECKKAFDKCKKNDDKCKRDAINKFRKDKNSDEDKNKGIGQSGKYICGTYDDQTKNVHTSFNFGCLGTAYAKKHEGQVNMSPIMDLVLSFVRFMSIGVGIVIAISMIFSGLQYTMSEGNADATQKAKNRIRSAALGFVIYLFTFAILQFLIPGGIFN